ncbi:MAG: L,D-transpeptidase family protein [Bdellovibrionaceae bacterium]|nr:L,D-transpeptidase family protein [Pseudobdellovibrionaceae bacterium]
MYRYLVVSFFLFLNLAQAGLNDSIKKWAEQDKAIQKLGKYLIQVDSVKRVYEEVNHHAIWVQDGQLTPAAYAFLDVLNDPSEFGFSKTDFVDPQLATLLAKEKNEGNLFWLEILLTDKWVQMSRYLYQGRITDYYILDDDTKLPRKSFEVWSQSAIMATMASDAQEIKNALRGLEPKNRIYQSLKEALNKVLAAEKEKTWKTLVLPKEPIELHASSAFIPELKTQLTHYGFKFESQSDVYDKNLADQLALFHKYYRTQEKGITTSLVKILNVGIESRKKKIFLAMEKARMLPNEFEVNHIFVNLAFQEFKLFENSKLVMEMKTINGQKFRRTPTLKDVVTVVELNPTWTVPFNIAVKDKLPRIKVDPGYLANHNMTLYDNATNEIVDPESIDWSRVTKANFNFRIVQGSGADNALGLVKFPLTNPWSIYLHDTNERHLFTNNQRLLSSGCVRLEKPFLFAEYVLRDQSSYTLDKITQIVKAGLDTQLEPKPTRIRMKKSLPVYTSFITTDISAEGILRFADDAYGSDVRLAGILFSRDSALSSKVDEMQADQWAEGLVIPENKAVISFSGNPTAMQISKFVKLYKCVKNKRNSCELKSTLEFNKKYLVDPADYIAIYENQIYAEVLTLGGKSINEIKMVDMQMPDDLATEARIRVFHDLNSTIEQKRILMESFYFSQSPLKFSQYDFGDYYLSSLGVKVMNERLDYGLCLNAKGLALTEEATEVCKIYRNAKSPEELKALFTFGASSLSEKYADGEFSQLWVSQPGDRFRVSHKRRLLAAPMSVNDRVMVFPGAYKARGEQSGKTVVIKTQ